MGTKDKPNSNDKPLVPDVSERYRNIWVIPSPVKSGIDVILVQESLREGVTDAEVPDVQLMEPLIRCVECTRDLLMVGALHMIIEGAGIVLIVNVGGGVQHNSSITVAEEEYDE